MFSSNVEAERSRRRESMSATRRSSRARYGGVQATEGKHGELEFDPLWHSQPMKPCADIDVVTRPEAVAQR